MDKYLAICVLGVIALSSFYFTPTDSKDVASLVVAAIAGFVTGAAITQSDPNR